MQAIGTCLWFDREAEDAANFYVSVFPDSRIVGMNRYVEGMPMPAGTVLTVRFVLAGREFVALNGGPLFQFTPAISFVAPCATQAEIDALWQQLSEGGAPGQCGWLTDRFGVTWQIVPTALMAMFDSPDQAATQRAVAAMMPMGKLDIAALERAFAGS